MQYEHVTDYKDTITGSIPVIELSEVKEHKDISKVVKQPCERCGERKNISLTMCIDGIAKPLCRECRKPVILDIPVRSLLKNNMLEVDNTKVLTTIDQLINIIEEYPYVYRISSESTGLKHKTTRSKCVDLYKKFGMKLTTKAANLMPLI